MQIIPLVTEIVRESGVSWLSLSSSPNKIALITGDLCNMRGGSGGNALRTMMIVVVACARILSLLWQSPGSSPPPSSCQEISTKWRDYICIQISGTSSHAPIYYVWASTLWNTIRHASPWHMCLAKKNIHTGLDSRYLGLSVSVGFEPTTPPCTKNHGWILSVFLNDPNH